MPTPTARPRNAEHAAIDEHHHGSVLYGDDFTPEEIREWYEDEAEGYSGLLDHASKSYHYAYHQLNRHLGFSLLPRRRFARALGVGSAYGHEFLPILDRIGELTIVEPSLELRRSDVGSLTPTYVSPDPCGTLPFEDGFFDLAVCLGVLHHIPNVTFVVREIHRCLASGGVLLVREPVVSLGDWRQPRIGLTKRERGIPLPFFDRLFAELGMTVVSRRHCVFSPLSLAARLLHLTPYRNSALTRLDLALSRCFAWNLRYHAVRPLHRIRPLSIYFVLQKGSA